jgi:3-dehydroquinate dehydratase-1
VLKRSRQSVYALADWTVHTDRLTPGQVAAEVVRAVRLLETTRDPPALFDVPAAPLGACEGTSSQALGPSLGASPPSPASAGGKRLEARGRPIAGGRLPLVCAPLVARAPGALLEEAAAVAARHPDLVEWRADLFEPIASADEVVEVARAIRAAVGEAPLIFTLRSAREGGNPVPIPPEQVVELYESVCSTGAADLVDFELGNAAESVRRVRDASRRGGVKLILSHHDFDRTPASGAIHEKFMEAQRMGADVAKVAVMPRSLDDVLTLLAATLHADRQTSIPLVGVSMGACGSLSRACGWMFGSAITYAVGQGSSAPGQMPVDDLRAAVEILRRSYG